MSDDNNLKYLYNSNVDVYFFFFQHSRSKYYLIENMSP